MEDYLKITEYINKNLNNLINTDEFQIWKEKKSFTKGDYVLFNNSVLYRNDIKTKKSSKYIALEITDPEIFTYEIKILKWNIKISDFSKIHHSDKRLESSEILDLNDAVQNELKSIGKLIFILIGFIDNSERFIEPINHTLFTQIVLDSSIANQLQFVDQNIFIKKFAGS